MSRPRLLIALLLASAYVAHTSGQRPPTITISVMATTDLHGGVLQRGERGGLALLGGYLRNLRAARARDGGGVLLVDSGDMFQGTLESNLNEGAAVVRAYNGLGYAAAAIGNHEFDFGPAGAKSTPEQPGDDPRGALKARAAEARFPFLAANIIDNATGQPVAWPNVEPSTMVTVAGVKIGIIGVTTLTTPVTTIAENLQGLTFAPLAPVVTHEAASLRARGASLIIVLAHAGGRCTNVGNPDDTSSCDQMAEVVELARQLPAGSVDLIAAGHTHAAMAQNIAGIPVVEAFNGGRAFSRVDFAIDRSSGKVVGKQIFEPRDLCAREDPVTHACDPAAAQTAKLVAARYENQRVRPDASAAAAMAPAVRRALMLKNQPLGVFLDTPLRKIDQSESALGDLFAEAVLEQTPGAEVSIGNGGSLRTDLSAGPLTYGKVYEVYPFDNRLVTLTLTGDQLARIVSYNLERREPPNEILPLAGVLVDAKCDGRMLRVALRRPSGTPIRPDERLTVVTSDFVYSGGDGVLAPAGQIGEAANPAGAPILREVVIDWLRHHGGRLSETDILRPDNRRWNYPGGRPVTCQ